MKRFILSLLLLSSALWLGITPVQAGRPVAIPETPVIQTAAAAGGAATEVATLSVSHTQSATLFILGMSVLLLLPVGIELLAPGSVGQAFRRHEAIMARRVQP